MSKMSKTHYLPKERDYLDYSNILLTKWNARFKQEKDKEINLYEGKDIVGGGEHKYQWVLGKRA